MRRFRAAFFVSELARGCDSAGRYDKQPPTRPPQTFPRVLPSPTERLTKRDRLESMQPIPWSRSEGLQARHVIAWVEQATRARPRIRSKPRCLSPEGARQKGR